MTIKNKTTPFLFLGIIVFTLFISFIPSDFAQGFSLVPCGRTADDPSTAINETQECTLCHLIVGIHQIVKFIYRIAAFVALALITFGGIMYIISSGQEDRVESAKLLMKGALVGLVLIFSAWLIVNTVFWVIGAKGNLGIEGKSWDNYECAISPPETYSYSDSGSSSSNDFWDGRYFDGINQDDAGGNFEEWESGGDSESNTDLEQPQYPPIEEDVFNEDYWDDLEYSEFINDDNARSSDEYQAGIIDVIRGNIDDAEFISDYEDHYMIDYDTQAGPNTLSIGVDGLKDDAFKNFMNSGITMDIDGSYDYLSESGMASYEFPFPSGTDDPIILGFGNVGEIADYNSIKYVLQSDVVASCTAFMIVGENVTLDLNGHTITYGNSAESGNCHGVIVNPYLDGESNQNYRYGSYVVNGTIKQSENATKHDVEKSGWDAIVYKSEGRGSTIGVSISYQTPDTNGISIYGSASASNNTINDLGSVVTGNEKSVAILLSGSGGSIRRNYIKSSRHIGVEVGSGVSVEDNVVEMEGNAEPSYGILASGKRNFRIYENQINLRGIEPIGIGIVAGSQDGAIYKNYFDVKSTKLNFAGGSSGSIGFMLQGGDDNNIYENHIVVHAQSGFFENGLDSWGRAVLAGVGSGNNSRFYKNTIVAIGNNGRARADAVVVGLNNNTSGLLFESNKIVSNWSNIVLADDSGYANGYPVFLKNTFVKHSNVEKYKTVKTENSSQTSTARFIGNTYEDGASKDNVSLDFCANTKKEIIFSHMEGDSRIDDYKLTNQSSGGEGFGECGRRIDL